MNAHEYPIIRTVLGDVRPERLGRVNYHEHLFQTTPLLPRDEINDERLSGNEAALALAGGIDAIVDATPWGLGRDPEAVARISDRTGLRVIATAGFHREAHYSERSDVLGLSLAAMTAQCISELLDGQPAADGIVGGPQRLALAPAGTPVRAGMLKAGVGYWSITAFERRSLDAVAAAHRVSGAPVMVHLEHGTCAHEALDALAEGGVAEKRVVLAHVDRSPDPILYAELAARGAYLGCDGAARLKEWPESILIEAIAQTLELGYVDHVLLGGDVARRSRYLAYGGMPGISYLTSRFVPRLANRVGDEAIRQLFTDNPKGLLTWTNPIE